MKQMYTLILMVIISVSAMAQDVSDDIRAAFANQDYLITIDLAQSCYDADTNHLGCLEILATAYNRSGDQANAKKYLHILERRDTSNIDVFIQLAGIYEQQQQYARAIKYYTKVNKVLPNNPLYFRKNANLYRIYGDKMESFRLYAKANNINSRDILSIKGLAELAMSNDQDLLADSLLAVGLSLDSMNISLNFLSARSLYRQRKYEEVVQVFDHIRGRVDLDSYNNKLLGYALLQIDSVDLAISKFQLALTDDRNPEKLHYYLATAFEKQGNEAGALEHYTLATKTGVSPDIDLYHRNIGRLASKANKYQTAISAYKDAYKYGDDPVVLYYLAAACDNYYKDKSIAINYYNKYLKSSHDHQEYREYSKKRVRYLKEVRHQNKSE